MVRLRKATKLDDDNDDKKDEERPYNVSTIKPSETDDYTEVPKVDIDSIWQSIAQTKKNFTDLGFSYEAYNYDVLGGNQRLGSQFNTELFFSKVDISNEPIRQNIEVIKRLKAWDYYKDKGSKTQRRRVGEFVVYTASLEGFDYLGNPIKTQLEKQGLSYEPDVRVKITTDQHGRQQGQYTFEHLRNRYYLPYSKKLVEDLIKNSNTNIDQCKFYVQVGSDPNSRGGIQFRYDGLTYDQFINSTFEELEAIARAPNTKWKDKPLPKEWVG